MGPAELLREVSQRLQSGIHHLCTIKCKELQRYTAVMHLYTASCALSRAISPESCQNRGCYKSLIRKTASQASVFPVLQIVRPTDCTAAQAACHTLSDPRPIISCNNSLSRRPDGFILVVQLFLLRLQ